MVVRIRCKMSKMNVFPLKEFVYIPIKMEVASTSTLNISPAFLNISQPFVLFWHYFDFFNVILFTIIFELLDICKSLFSALFKYNI